MSSRLLILVCCLLLCCHTGLTQNATTDIPTTETPTTVTPTTVTPTTATPTTAIPTTAVPTTATPTTGIPTTATPTTPIPTTVAPTTPNPTTVTPTTVAPTTVTPTTLPPTPAPTTGPPTIPPVTVISSPVGISLNPGTSTLSLSANPSTRTANTTITLICTAGLGNASSLALTIAPQTLTYTIPPPANPIPFYLGRITTTSGSQAVYKDGISLSVQSYTSITNIRMISPTIPDGTWNSLTSQGYSVGLFAFDSNANGFMFLLTASADMATKTVGVDIPFAGVSPLTLLFAWYPSSPSYFVPPVSPGSPISSVSTIANLNALYNFPYGLSIRITSAQGAMLTVQPITTLSGQIQQAQANYGQGFIYFTITLAPQISAQSVLTFSWTGDLLNSIGAGRAHGFKWAYYNANRNIWQDSGSSQPTSQGYVSTTTTQPLTTTTTWGVFNAASILPISWMNTLFVILCSCIALMS